MITTLSYWTLIGFSVLLLGVGLAGLCAPRSLLRGINRAESWRPFYYMEAIVMAWVGAAMLAFSPHAYVSGALASFGAAILVGSLVLVFVPKSAVALLAQARETPFAPLMMRLSAPVAFAAAIGLFLAVA